MSDAALIILLIVGGVVVWGALTDWTFSGLLPREGAKCTPRDDEKDENAKQYVYDEDNKCTVIQSCKTGWEPNSSNTACISTSTGDPCTVSDPDPKGVYKRDTSNVCVLDSCITGYQKSDTGCVLIETCDPATTEYDETQDGKCLGEDNEIVDCQETDLFKDITFKSGCGTNNIVHNNIELRDTDCDDEHSGSVKVLCNATPGCIGYRTLEDGCSRLIVNTPPVCERHSRQMYVDYVNSDLDGEGKLVGGNNTHYLNIPCRNDPDARYEKWGDPADRAGGGCDNDIYHHEVACSLNPHCVGFHLFDDDDTKCSHFLRKKTILPDDIKDLEKDNGGWSMNTLSGEISPGFRAVRGTIDSDTYGDLPGYTSLITNSSGEQPDTIQGCFDNASENARVIGIRTAEHGNDGFKNTCWEYGDGYQYYITNEEDLISPESHLMVCRDPTRDIMKKEC